MREVVVYPSWLAMTLSTFVALSLFGLSAQWYWEETEQRVLVRRVSPTIPPRQEIKAERVRKSVELVPHSK